MTGPGCSKRIPLEEPEIQARHAIVLTFTDGSQIKGKVGLDETIELITGGTVYRGVVTDVTDEEIVIEDCRFVSRAGDHSAGRARMVSSRVDLGYAPASFIFQRADIERYERIKVDTMRTATRSAFWGLTGVVAVFLLSEKS
jgi:hypothetical protein